MSSAAVMIGALKEALPKIYGSVHEILVLMAYAQTPLINATADISSWARGLNFGLSLHLHPFFVDSSKEGSDYSALMCKLA